MKIKIFNLKSKETVNNLSHTTDVVSQLLETILIRYIQYTSIIFIILLVLRNHGLHEKMMCMEGTLITERAIPEMW